MFSQLCRRTVLDITVNILNYITPYIQKVETRRLGDWEALNTGLYTLHEAEDDEARHGTGLEEKLCSLSQYSVSIVQGIMHVGVSL